ncbi:unnamed protein product [Gordionus sp. m RMFG-2023]|uniref:pre-mRNA-splicing factor SPF27-like n=1 Tax=Gordionus sp. m RMFG-2023 TaxID=3053472 RepID=UPI0030E4B38B
MSRDWNTNEVIVDALPYIDQGFDDLRIREIALSLVEEETKRYKPTKNYLEHLPQLNLNDFETDIMKNEFARIANHNPMEMMNMRRYELPTPPPGKLTDITAWNEAVENSMAQLEHQATRISNLELMGEYGSIAWKNYNKILNIMVEELKKQLIKIKKKTQEVNWQRKNDQINVGRQLQELESSWVGLVSKNYEIERAIVELEKEIKQVQDKSTN